jgi:serine protease Do
MSKRSTLVAIALVTSGIVLGAVFAAGFDGIRFSFADGDARFTTAAPYNPPESVANLNDAFKNVSSLVTPTVVSITVKAKTKNPHQFFWPFGEQGQEDQIQQGMGSGIILTADGYILTNKHVVEGATEDGIKVTLNDSRGFTARLIGKDENTDIAVVKIDAKDLTPASLGNSDDVKVGEWVMAVGNPLGLTSTVTAGIVSAISRNINIIETKNKDGGIASGIENFIQTDAAINPGNSGGALVNLHAQVVGVNTAIATETGRYIGYGFAVPINLAKVVAQGIIKDGKFVRGYIGVTIKSMDAVTAKALKIDRFKGVLVQSVQKNGAGQAAGLKAGDVIVEVEGKDVASGNELQARVGMHHPDETITLKVFRDGKYMDFSVRLKARDEAVADDQSGAEDTEIGGTDNARGSMTFDKAGFTVIALDAAAKKQFKIESGVFVSDVKAYSPAYDNTLRPNVVIFEARQGGTVTKIESIADLKNVLLALKDGDSILLRVQDVGGNTAFIPIEGPVK